MPYILVEDFRYGLDTRKSAVTAPPGTLRTFEDGHITRGGEIEKAKAFVEKYALPAGETFGMAELGDDLYVFGSVASPTLPAGVNYQRLVHPDDSSIAMSGVIFTQVFNSKLYVIAEFENDEIFHYYDGELDEDWGAGRARAGMVNNNGIATHLAALIDTDEAVTASAVGNVITITAVEEGVPFTIEATAENEGSVDNQTATAATPTPAVEGVAEVLASQTFTITGGSANTKASGTVTLNTGAAGSVDTIKVNGVDIMSGAVAYNTSLTQTAADVASNINAYTSSPNYSATSAGQVITILAEEAVGADANGFVVASTVTTITKTDANMAGGVTNAVTSVTVDGIEILSTRVNWTSSNSTVAANVAAQINSYVSAPDYDASNTGAIVSVKGDAGSGATPNGKALAVTVAGNVTVTVAGSGIMAGGMDEVPGQTQVSTVTIGGTFEVGDAFTVTINDYPYGAESRPAGKASTLLTFKKKMYFGEGDILDFSAVGVPTKVSFNDTGAGFIVMSNEAPKFQNITALGSYFNELAIFSKKVIQLWGMDADPSKNAQSQIVSNTGTEFAKSLQSVGEGDILYLDRSGFRSLKARDSSNFASVAEIGTAVDEEVTALLKTLTAEQKAKVCSITEPLDRRYSAAINETLYVFSFFSGAKVSAWSRYNPGFAISDFVTINDFMYARSDDTIYLYGGDNGDQYVDSTVVTLPFLDGKAPATSKQFYGMDVALQGLWKVEIATDPENPDTFEHIMNIASVTYAQQNIPIEGESTHIAVRFTALDASYGKISNLAIHYHGGDAG